ncbi:MAG: CBS domain-containing protein [Candidatus Krumholzibacteria bacterium]|nr:CBS domain-containing protein [Candidatus Krumholzibacteria bacterium]
MTAVTVKRLLEEKGNQVWSIAPEASVYSALQLMADKGIGALLVLDQGKLVGVISERDYARKIVLLGKTSRETTVREIMSTKVYYVRPDQRIEECMALMTQKAVRHLPVMEGDALVGIISIGDVVKTIISEQQFIIEQLEQFITGR